MHFLQYLILEEIVREINFCERIVLGRLTINILVYVDDIALLGKNKDENTILLIKAVEKVGCRINEDKWST